MPEPASKVVDFIILSEDAESKLDEDLCAVAETKLFVQLGDSQVPVVFHPDYDITFFGLERYHVFDASKWGKVYRKLVSDGFLDEAQVVRPEEATYKDLRVAHTKRYLKSLRTACNLAKVFEMFIVAIIPACVTDKYLLRRMRLHVGGTVAACRLALQRNWAINIGGGFHHASGDSGGGFCVYADITIAIKMLLLLKLVKSVMIIDVDAHQGNGHERDFLNDPRVFIVDIFNPSIYPRDETAKHGISHLVEVKNKTGDFTYVNELENAVGTSLGQFSADLIVYNAGTDSLVGDPLGQLGLTTDGIVARDELIFQLAREHNTPIAMVTSGGYQQDNWEVIARSIKNLHHKGLIRLNSSI